MILFQNSTILKSVIVKQLIMLCIVKCIATISFVNIVVYVNSFQFNVSKYTYLILVSYSIHISSGKDLRRVVNTFVMDKINAGAAIVIILATWPPF